MLATYAGTKSFLSSFSAALAEEVKGKGIDVECLNTYFVVCPLYISCYIVVPLQAVSHKGIQVVQGPQVKRHDSDTKRLCPICPSQGNFLIYTA